MSRTQTSIHRLVAAAVMKKLKASPENPISKTGRRPKRSDRAPRMGEPKKLAIPKENETAPNQNAWSALDWVNSPTRCGRTGIISPIAIMSISTAIMMKRMAAGRATGAAGGVGWSVK